MGQAVTEVHVAIVNNDPNYIKPEGRHLLFGDDMTAGGALAQARRITQGSSSSRGMTFIEKTGEPATKPLECDLCTDRKQRHGHVLP